MKKKRNKAQSLVEIMVFTIVVVSALLAMRVFMTRTVQQKFKESVETLGGGEQFEKDGVTLIRREYRRNVR